MNNLREVFEKERMDVIAKILELKKNPEFQQNSRSIIDNMLIPKFKELQRKHPTSNYYCITFYAVDRGRDASYVCYNTNFNIGYDVGDPCIEVTKEALQLAVHLVNDEYNPFTAFESEEKGTTFFRFELKL